MSCGGKRRPWLTRPLESKKYTAVLAALTKLAHQPDFQHVLPQCRLGERFLGLLCCRGPGTFGSFARRLFRLSKLAIELLAKLPDLLRRQGLEAAQDVVELGVRHTAIFGIVGSLWPSF